MAAIRLVLYAMLWLLEAYTTVGGETRSPISVYEEEEDPIYEWTDRQTDRQTDTFRVTRSRFVPTYVLLGDFFSLSPNGSACALP